MAKILNAQVKQSSYINGFSMSSAGAGSFSIATGDCLDSTRAYTITLGSAFTKTNGAWASGSGNGSLDTGSAANNTTYFVFAIFNPTTDAVDILISTSVASPTMPSGYTYKRRIGVLTTATASTNFTAFYQVDKTFYWNAGFNFTTGSIGTGATNFTLQQCPTGLAVVPLFIPTMNTFTNNTPNSCNFAQQGQTLATPTTYNLSPTDSSMTTAYTTCGGSAGEGSADAQNPTVLISSIPTSNGGLQAKVSNTATTLNIYFIGFIDSTLYN